MAIKRDFQKQTIPDDLDLIKDQLYIGAYDDIASATGYSTKYVKDVINGLRRNNAIIESARQLIADNRKSLGKIKTRFNRDTYKRLRAAEKLNERKLKVA